MIIGYLRIELYIPGNTSLKGKRMVLKSLKDRIRNRFNVSVAEVDDWDKWQKASLGVACVGGDKRHINRVLSKVADLLEGSPLVELVDYELEMF